MQVEHGLPTTGADIDDNAVVGQARLARGVGEPGERDFWPVLRLTVHPATEGMWNELRMRLAIDDDDELVKFIVEACDAMKRRRKKAPTS